MTISLTDNANGHYIKYTLRIVNEVELVTTNDQTKETQHSLKTRSYLIRPKSITTLFFQSFLLGVVDPLNSNEVEVQI